MSFAVLAKELKDYLTLITFDWKSHGMSTWPAYGDFSVDSLIQDALEILVHINTLDEFKDRSIIICGHSMGGAIASKLVTYLSKHSDHVELFKKIKSLFVIDVVEGSALDALPMMEQIVKSRPQSFNSVQEAIKWANFNHLSRNLDAAWVGMPQQLI